ncbi:DUF6684 family protein [Halomarina salina]|uniref:DUF6684 family protein n=1 Tax=Halomarina salina TaxID=1872699 RepID=A0ABD5RIF1_9EURY|nr:DUF6684 family protein [Halomarina salina]
MAPDVFDRETMLDLSVNIIPLFIILFFVVVFAVITPFGISLVPTVIQMGLLIVPFVGLAILTYYSGKAIAESEAEIEAREREITNENAVDGSSDDTSELTDGEDDGSTETPITGTESNDGK